MKAKFFKFSAMLSLTAIAALSEFTTAAQELPFGQWDFVINGKEFGTAVINFNKEESKLSPNFFTLDGLQITIDNRRNRSSNGGSDDSRGGSGSRGVGDTGTNSTSSSSCNTTNIDGGAALFGAWTVDTKGRIVGYYYQTAIDPNSTNADFELPVSFVGIHRPGKRLNLKAANGCITTTMRGVPAGRQPDITGTWVGKGKLNGSFFADQNVFTPRSSAPPGIFDVAIEGGGYFIGRTAMASAQHRLSIVGTRVTVDPLATNYVVRVVSGSLNSSATKARLKGEEGINSITDYRLERLSFPVP